MSEEAISEWVRQFEQVDESSITEYADKIISNNELPTHLFRYFDVTRGENNKKMNKMEVENMLLKYCQSRNTQLTAFTLQYLPHIVYAYLNAISRSDKTTSLVMETLIIGIYNLQITDENGQPTITSFRLPSLAQPSIYHEPVSLAPASLTEAALKRLENRNSQLVRLGPFHQVKRLNAQSRYEVLSQLLFYYNETISSFSKLALEALCKVTRKLVTQGFSNAPSRPRHNYSVPSTLPRITLPPSILCQLLHALYYATFNGCKWDAIQAIEDIAFRASYHCYTDVLLLTNSMKSCTSHKPSHATGTPVHSLANVVVGTMALKSMITNASFRTKKLPDDIPIQDPQLDGSVVSLASINEDGNKETNNAANTTESGPKRSLPKMAVNFGKKTRDKIATVKSTGVASIKGLGKSISLPNGGKDIVDIPELDEFQSIEMKIVHNQTPDVSPMQSLKMASFMRGGKGNANLESNSVVR